MSRSMNRWTQTAGTTRLAALGLAATLAVASVAQAQPGPSGGPGRRGHPGSPAGPLGGWFGTHVDVPLRALNLTDAQREQVKTILEGHREEGRALAERARAAFQAIDKASAESVDEGAIAQQGQALASVITEGAILRAKVRTEVFAVLTPEQQAQAAKLKTDRQARMEQRRQQRRKK